MNLVMNLDLAIPSLLLLPLNNKKALEKVQNMLAKSDDMLGEEMDQSQTLTDNLQRLQTKFYNLQSHHTLYYLITRSFLTDIFKESKILSS